jgi:exodeoxyribonuclease V gamma subunit
MAGFGSLAAKNLAMPVIAMLTRYGSLVEHWPRVCDPMEIDLVIHQDDWPEARVNDWLDNMITTDSMKDCATLPRFARQQFYPRNILDKGGKLLLLHPLVPLWVGHVAGCAMGIDLKSHLIAPDAVAAFHPLDKTEAFTILMEILTVFNQGLSRPLPVTAKTGLAYVAALTAKDEQRAKNDAARVYAGDGFNARGELGYDPYLQRPFPDFDLPWQARNNLFKDLAVTLYQPMVQAVEREG